MKQMPITTNKLRCIQSCLAPDMAHFVSENGRYLRSFKEDRPKNSRRSRMRPVCGSYERRSTSIAIGLSNDRKWVFNEMSLMPWSRALVRFEVKISFFQPWCSSRRGTNPTAAASAACAAKDIGGHSV